VGGSLAAPRDRLWSDEVRHPTLIFGLDVPKAVLEERIRERTDAMFESGVGEEVARALRTPVSRTASQIIGLREIAELPRDEAVAAIVLRTRRYAAYQRKWLRRIPRVQAVSADRPALEIAVEILARAQEA
jgi:tRNA dimethylallyltransferase